MENDIIIKSQYPYAYTEMQILEAENRRNRAIIIAFVASNTFIFLSSFESVLNYPKILKYIASVVVIYQIFLVYRLSSKVIT